MNAFLAHEVYPTDGLVLELDRTGIDSTGDTAGSTVNSWTCRITGTSYTDPTGNNPVLEVSSGRAVDFDGTDALSATEYSQMDLICGTDDMTFVIQLGDATLGTGTLIAKSTDGASNMQYQCTIANLVASAHRVGHNFGSTSATDHFVAWEATSNTISSGDLLIFTVDSSDDFGATVYQNGTALSTTFQTNDPSGHTVGRDSYTSSNGHPIFIGARRDNSDTAIGFPFEGSMGYVLAYNKELNSAEVTMIKQNLYDSGL